jgi:pyruvate/2-oxoglutarate dehydrogenase complex dihydrolipoamide dehydrogenase (E3) component
VSPTGRVVVLGAGAAGEHFVGALRRLDPDIEIVVVEQGLAGGECSYYACIPTKTLLRPLEATEAARRAPGAAEAITGEPDLERLLWWRDEVTDRRHDDYHVGWLADQRAELVRGHAEVPRPGVVVVEGRELEYTDLVIATGSRPAIPPIDGIDDVPVWTSRDAVWADTPPKSLVVLGGGPVGVELAQYFRRLGSEVTVVQSSSQLVPHVDAEAGELLQTRLEEEGIRVVLDARAERAEARPNGARVELSSGDALDCERVLVATGRRANVENMGLEQLGVRIAQKGIEVDERMRAADGVWAIGDPTGVALLTHVGKYQARVAAANIAGQDYRADYRAIPAAVFTDPQVASVGTTAGEGLVTASFRIDGGRLTTYERPRRPGLLKLAADRSARVLVGAVAVAPESGEWIGQLTLAVRARVPLETLLDTIQPYPTFSESIFAALSELEQQLVPAS